MSDTNTGLPGHDVSCSVQSLPWPAQTLPFGEGQLAIYDTAHGPTGRGPHEPPLLVVHSVNAAASAFEWEPFVLRQARRRRVLALDLPGFGLSDKTDRAYTPELMSAAVKAAIDWSGAAAIDIAALSLGCEFVAQAVLDRPERVRSLALVSPSGMEGRRVGEKYEQGKTREIAWLRRWLRGGSAGSSLYRVLTSELSMNYFLRRSWGTGAYDRRLLQHALRCAQQHGAHHAPLDFVAGALFTQGIIERYRALPVPVWVAHGRRGSFTDFDACPERTGTAAAGNTFRLHRQAFDSGSMPHFELADAFDAAYLRFLFELKPSSLRWRTPHAAATASTQASRGAGMPPARAAHDTHELLEAQQGNPWS